MHCLRSELRVVSDVLPNIQIRIALCGLEKRTNVSYAQ